MSWSRLQRSCPTSWQDMLLQESPPTGLQPLLGHSPPTSEGGVSDLVATEWNRQVRMPDDVCKMQTGFCSQAFAHRTRRARLPEGSGY
mmetsp:Transcript_55548/g.132812  ORF Transcript_55548/g.132812 Transcript_55548/m.132812 type:complete len:88 (+) Transcript_55548:677-940(+)